MFNSNSHLIGDMARMHRESLIEYADEQRLHRLMRPGNETRWAKMRARVGDWLIAAGEKLKPVNQPMIGRQAHQS